jgi:hypothetical protein
LLSAFFDPNSRSEKFLTIQNLTGTKQIQNKERMLRFFKRSLRLQFTTQLTENANG